MVARIFLAGSILVSGTIACAGEGPTNPTPPADRPMLVNGCDTYSPTSADIPIDSVVNFVRDTAGLGCGYRYGEITPANGTAGFSHGTVCTLTGVLGGIVFKVLGCAQGSVQLKIYSDSTKTTVLQTIPISVGLL